MGELRVGPNLPGNLRRNTRGWLRCLLQHESTFHVTIMVISVGNTLGY